MHEALFMRLQDDGYIDEELGIFVKGEEKIPFYGNVFVKTAFFEREKNLLDFPVGVRQLFYYWWFVFLYL